MLFWSMKITIISIILIFLVHHLLVFFKTNLTTPKIKDLVNAPTQKYDAIFNAMNHTTPEQMSSQYITLEELLPSASTTQQQQPDPVDMKNELKQFMKKQFKENSTLDTISNSNSSTMQYSNY